MESDGTDSKLSGSLLSDAIAHPWRKWGWWLIVTICGFLLFWSLILVLSGSRGSARVGLISAALAAVMVRCYFSAMENTITGWGENPAEGSGLRMDEFWETLGRVVLAALIAWSPAVIAAIALPGQDLPLQPWVNILAALGCAYFPMALLGIVNFGGLHGAMPQVVIPGVFRSGVSYMFASLGLLLVPYSAFWMFAAFPEGGNAALLAASATAAFFLLAHARLIGRIYLANRERLGWE
jgi:hypothetical protein